MINKVKIKEYYKDNAELFSEIEMTVDDRTDVMRFVTNEETVELFSSMETRRYRSTVRTYSRGEFIVIEREFVYQKQT